MPEQSSATPRSDQLDRIEAKLDQVLEFRDQLLKMMTAFSSGGTGMLLKAFAKARRE